MGKKNTGQNQEGDVEVIDLVKIRRHEGTELILPTNMNWSDVRRLAIRKEEEDEQAVNFSEVIPVFPWDGAIALRKALEQLFGAVIQNEGFFGARMINIATGYDKKTPVPWGSFSLPGIEDGYIGCSADIKDERVVFSLVANVKRKYMKVVEEVAELTRQIVARESIYRGQAIRMKFRTSSGNIDTEAQPEFMDLRNVERAIFQRLIQEEIETNIHTPIRYADVVKEDNASLKRGVLFAGPFGVGKTLLAQNIAREAVANGWTFLYCNDVAELPDALKFAQSYGRTVVFAEDIDRVTSGNRNAAMDEISYALDGINSKNTDIITIVTTNKPEAINPMIIRAGRMDVVLFLDSPDADAVVELIKEYAGNQLNPETDLTEASKLLAGQIPAVIKEVVKRSRLQMLNRTQGEGGLLVGDDLSLTARSYLRSNERLTEKTNNQPENFAFEFGKGFAEPIGKAMRSYVAEMHTNGTNGAQSPATVSSQS